MIFSLVAMTGLEKCCITSAYLQWLCHSGERPVARGPLVFPDNRIWYFMQIVSSGDNLHEMSKPVFMLLLLLFVYEIWKSKKNISMCCLLKNLPSIILNVETDWFMSMKDDVHHLRLQRYANNGCAMCVHQSVNTWISSVYSCTANFGRIYFFFFFFFFCLRGS